MSLKTSDRSSRQIVPPASARGLSPAERWPHAHAVPHVLIKSEAAGVQLNLGDLWSYRELLYFLTLRDIKVRYKQTLMGAAWVIVQPLMLMLIVTLVFTRFARLEVGAMPYPLFAYSGLLLWTFFSSAVANSTNSLTSNTNLITKVYFPRLFIPAAAVAAGLVDLGIASLLLAALAVYYRVHPTWSLALLPVFVALLTLLALGDGVLVSALTVKYRDLRHALPFILQFWMFASPVIYPATAVPPRWKWLVTFNPLAGALEGFRASLSGGEFDRRAVFVSALIALALAAVAVYVFRRAEDTFADVI
ncbi:MAG: ABC transporter permease [Pyrinomonadaceae bacterium]